MSKAFRNFLLVAAVLIIVGGIITGIGFVFGGLRSVALTQNGPVIVGFENDTVIEVNESYNKITDITVDVDISELKFEEGTSFSLKGRYNPNIIDLKINESNGVLTISGKALSRNQWHFGWFFNDLSIGYDETLVFTYPKGTEFKSIKINNSLGSLDLQNLKAKSLSVSLDLGDFNGDSILVDSIDTDLNLGSCSINHLTVTKDAKFRLDSGSLTLRNSTVNNLVANNNLGSFRFSGKLTGKAEATLDVGSLDMDLENKDSELSYSIGADLGSIRINGKEYGASAHRTVNSPICTLDISLSLGGVRLNTE